MERRFEESKLGLEVWKYKWKFSFCVIHPHSSTNPVGVGILFKPNWSCLQLVILRHEHIWVKNQLVSRLRTLAYITKVDFSSCLTSRDSQGGGEGDEGIKRQRRRNDFVYRHGKCKKLTLYFSRRRGGAQEDGESTGKRWRGREDSRRSGNSWRGGGGSEWRGGDYRSYRGRDGDWRREGNQDWRSKGRGRGQSQWQGNRQDGSGPSNEDRRRQNSQVRAENSDLVSYPGRYE